MACDGACLQPDPRSWSAGETADELRDGFEWDKQADIQIACGPRMPVQRQRVGADDQKRTSAATNARNSSTKS
jgi:hypothetical protein